MSQFSTIPIRVDRAQDCPLRWRLDFASSHWCCGLRKVLACGPDDALPGICPLRMHEITISATDEGKDR